MTKNNQIVLLALSSLFIGILYIKIGPPEKAGTVRLAQPTIIASLPIWVAEEKGFFKRRKLTIETKDYSQGKMMVQSLIDGYVDVLPAVSLVDLATLTDTKKVPLLEMQIFSHSRMKRNPSFESIIVPQGSKYSTVRDLEGKRIAVFPGITSELTVRHFLRVSKVNDASIRFIRLKPPEHEPALLRGDVQAVHLYEPFRSLALSNQKTRELYGSIYADLNEPSAIGTSAISRKFIELKPSEAKRFIEVWNESIDFIRKNPNESRRILAERLSIPHKIANDATWVDATKSNETNIETLDKTVRTLQAVGIVPNDFLLEKEMVYKP